MSPTEIEKLKIERTGKISNNKFGDRMEIINYNGVRDITVKFENGYITKSNYKSFSEGSLTTPYDKTVYEHGFLGEGKYKPSDNNKKRTKQYLTWQEMLRRCYDNKLHERHHTYDNCTVCEEWLDFQTFSKWYDENIYEAKDEEMNLDKDILLKNNKLYSPDTCVFSPKRINTLFTKGDSIRGLYPIGVSLHSRDNRFRACCGNGSRKNIKLGSFPTPEEAFSAYKVYKENLIKTIAEEYKPLIPNNLYIAMINYQVEITD